METTYYTLYTRQADEAGMARVSGGEDRPATLARRPAPEKRARREDNVISLAEYRARLRAEDGSGEREEPLDGETAEAPAPRARTDHSADRLCLPELAACAAMICVAVVACVALLF